MSSHSHQSNEVSKPACECRCLRFWLHWRRLARSSRRVVTVGASSCEVVSSRRGRPFRTQDRHRYIFDSCEVVSRLVSSRLVLRDRYILWSPFWGVVLRGRLVSSRLDSAVRGWYDSVSVVHCRARCRDVRAQRRALTSLQRFYFCTTSCTTECTTSCTDVSTTFLLLHNVVHN